MKNRFWGRFFLSPLIGLVIVLTYKSKEDEAYKEKMLETQQKQEEALSNLSKPNQSDSSAKSIADELEKLKKLKGENLITEEEFQKLREKLI